METCDQVLDLLRELETSRKLIIDLTPLETKKDPLKDLGSYHHESFDIMEWRYIEGLDRLKVDRKEKKLKMDLNPYTLQEFKTCISKLKYEDVEYGMDAYELILQDGKVQREDRRLWFLKV